MHGWRLYLSMKPDIRWIKAILRLFRTIRFFFDIIKQPKVFGPLTRAIFHATLWFHPQKTFLNLFQLRICSRWGLHCSSKLIFFSISEKDNMNATYLLGGWKLPSQAMAILKWPAKKHTIRYSGLSPLDITAGYIL